MTLSESIKEMIVHTQSPKTNKSSMSGKPGIVLRASIKTDRHGSNLDWSTFKIEYKQLAKDTSDH